MFIANIWTRSQIYEHDGYNYQSLNVSLKVRLHRRFGLAISLSDVISIFQFSLKSHHSAKLLAPHRLCKVVFTQAPKQLIFLAGDCNFNENWKIEITLLSKIANPNRLCKRTLTISALKTKMVLYHRHPDF